MLVVLGEAGLGTFGDGYAARPDWSPSGDYLTVLHDGTLFVPSRNRLTFGVGWGDDRRWSTIMVSTP